MEGDIRICLRTESWKPAPGADCGLLLVGRSDTCLALLMKRDPGTRTWTYGVARFPMGALAVPRAELAGRIDATMDPGPMVSHLGLHHEMPGRLVEALMGPWLTVPPKINREALSHPAVARLAGIGFAPMASESCFTGKFIDAPVLPVPMGSARPIRRDRTFAFDAQVVRHPIPDGTGPACTVEGEELFGLTAYAEKWYRRMAKALYPKGMRFLNASHWTAALHAHYTLEGTAGDYRRQAGALYPMLAPMLAHDPEVVALIDAGRPYEGRICEVLNGLGLAGRDDGFTVAKLRRLRGTRSMARMTSLHDFLRLAAILPSERIPLLTRSIPGLPTGYVDVAQMSQWVDGLGLDLLRLTSRVPEGAVLPMLRDAVDLVKRCAETLAIPILGEGAMARHQMIAGRLLYAGLDLARVKALSDRWHSRLDAFENALPEGRDLVTWPALFDPFEHAGIRITCLTRQSQLRAEGSSGRDRDGVRGLGHCVGGYGLRCFTGGSHVASVRRLESGTWTRVSTLEIDMGVGPHPAVAQHRGAANGNPPDDAVRAVDALIDGLASGVVPMAPEALALRSGDEFRDGVRWEEPGSIRRSWQAWRPYLPKRVAALDLAGFEAHLRGIDASTL